MRFNRQTIRINTMLDEKMRLFLPVNLIPAILAISTASIFIRFAQTERAPSLVIAAIQLSITSVIGLIIQAIFLTSRQSP